MKRHQFIKLWAYGALGIFATGVEILIFAAVFNNPVWLNVGGVITVNAVLFSLVPVAFFGDDLDIPWRN